MQFTVTAHGSIAVLEPAGSIDARASLDFQRLVLDHLTAGTRQFVIDLAQVDHMAGSGIRVLILLALRLKAAEGALVICSLNEQMRRAFEVAGLSQQFQFAVSRNEALALLSAPVGPHTARSRAASKLSRRVARLLDDTGGTLHSQRPPGGSGPTTTSELTRRVATLLAAGEIGQAEELSTSPPKK
jgi:anti-anti-sigma factor